MTPHPFEHDELIERIRTSKAILGHPVLRDLPAAKEPPADPGTHYEVLDTTEWEGYFVPTRVEWVHGEKDDFTDLMQSLDNRSVAIESVDGEVDPADLELLEREG